MFVSEQMIVSEARRLVRLLVNRQVKWNGLKVYQATYREAVKSGVPESGIKSLFNRDQQTVSGAVIENLRNRYEAIHNELCRQELREEQLRNLARQEFDPEINQALAEKIRKIDSLFSPVEENPPQTD